MRYSNWCVCSGQRNRVSYTGKGYITEHPLNIDEAVRAGDKDAVRAALARGEDVNTPSGISRSTPLAIAAETNNPQMIRFLVENGAEINARNIGREYETALSVAAFWGSWHALDELLNLGADPMIRLSGGITPLMMASQEGHIDIVDRLLTDGNVRESIDSPDTWGQTALHYALVRCDVVAIDRLLQAGAFGGVISPSGSSYLIYAIKRGCNISIIDRLIVNGSPINAVNNKGNTALMQLMAEGWQYSKSDRQRIADRLIASGADVNIQNQVGETALMYAVPEIDMVLMLVQAGADSSLKDTYGKTALDRANDVLSDIIGNPYGVDDKRERDINTVIELLQMGGMAKKGSVKNCNCYWS